MGAGHLMRLRHLTSCCATSVARGEQRRSAEGCLLWAAEEFSLILNLVTPALVRSRRFPWIWMHSVRHIHTCVCSYLTSHGLTKQSNKMELLDKSGGIKSTSEKVRRLLFLLV